MASHDSWRWKFVADDDEFVDDGDGDVPEAAENAAGDPDVPMEHPTPELLLRYADRQVTCWEETDDASD